MKGRVVISQRCMILHAIGARSVLFYRIPRTNVGVWETNRSHQKCSKSEWEVVSKCIENIFLIFSPAFEVSRIIHEVSSHPLRHDFNLAQHLRHVLRYPFTLAASPFKLLFDIRHRGSYVISVRYIAKHCGYEIELS